MGEMAEHPEHVKVLEEWMKSDRPQELFDSVTDHCLRSRD
jgi:phosphoketolase